jgi:hypothetical protein
MKNNNKKVIIASIIIVLIVFLVITPLGLCYMIYQDNFGNRYETISWMARSLDEFNGLRSQRYTFESDNEQQLVGYKYYKETNNVKGVVVIAHGLGEGGHNSYMDVANYLATYGYTVFAYDATGNDESEGDSVVGIPQGLIDLDYAIQFIKENDEFDNLPLMLFGHSWGAYSVGSVLNIHPDIEAVVMVAGFNKSLDILREEGLRIMGDSFSVLMPYFSVLERIKFGHYSSYNCIDGFDASNAGVMIVHSLDDNMISFEDQFNMFLDTYGDKTRFEFFPYEDRGHDYVYYTDASRQYNDELHNQFEEYVNTLDAELTAEMKREYMENNINRARLFDLDTELMDSIVSFYDNYTK